jgi:hypothetical protein
MTGVMLPTPRPRPVRARPKTRTLPRSVTVLPETLKGLLGDSQGLYDSLQLLNTVLD